MISALISVFEKSSVPVYIVPGNHDIHGNLSTFESQPLNVLVKAGVMKVLCGKPVLFDNCDIKVSLNGIPFMPALDSKESAEKYNLDHFDSDIKISMFHQMVLPDDKKFFLDYVNFSDLRDINADVVVCGHYHEGFTPSMVPVENSSGGFTYFLNGGSITRGTAEQANFDKVPKFISLEVKNNGAVVPTIVAYVNAIPYVASDDVFDFNVIERNKKKQDMHKFMEGLSEMESQSLSTQEPSGILNVLKLLGLESRLEPLAMQYLDDAYAALQ